MKALIIVFCISISAVAYAVGSAEQGQKSGDSPQLRMSQSIGNDLLKSKVLELLSGTVGFGRTARLSRASCTDVDSVMDCKITAIVTDSQKRVDQYELRYKLANQRTKWFCAGVCVVDVEIVSFMINDGEADFGLKNFKLEHQPQTHPRDGSIQIFERFGDGRR